MRNIPVIACILCLLAGNPVISAEPSGGSSRPASTDMAAVLKAVKKAESGIRDLSFSFVQKTALKGAGEPQEVTGKITMTRNPERFRVDYESPVRQVAIYDGKTLMVYMPESGQAFRQKAGDMDLKKMLGFDPSAPLGAFEGRYQPEITGFEGGICRISFKAGDKAGTVWNMALDSGNWLVSEISFDNSDMNMTIICSDYRMNRGVKAGIFRFKLPPGTEVVEGIPMLMGPGKSP